VTSDSEQGLLGLAFHPQFHTNGRLFVYYTTRKNGVELSRVSAFQSGLLADGTLAQATGEQVLLEVVQPYANHNAGQVFFSPEGYLFIALGDGGFEGDPYDNAQNPNTLLGSLLRIDVDNPADGKLYGIPPDNPFVGRPGARPEVYAIGLRNPWRASLDPQGRVVVGDVGQELWEEISVVEAGKNYGWNVVEGRHCYQPRAKCKTEGFVPPIHEYPHGDEGQSVTGGYVYLARRIEGLQGKYVFGDFITGRLWAMVLPEDASQPVEEVYTLGQWPIIPSTFGRNGNGDVFVADFASGSIFAIGRPQNR
jgi:glucose/arabinose dehydrogenase